MRYSTALVLGTLVVGQAAAHNGRHASFHARRAAESKRDVDFTNKALYKDVDWSKIDWDEVFRQSQNTPTPEPTPEVKVAQKQEATPTPEPTSTKASSAAKTASSTTEEQAEETDKGTLEKIGDKISDFLEGLVDGIDDFCKEKGIAGAGKNDKSANGGIWIGHSDWSANFHNAGSDKLWLACWLENSFTGMTLNVNAPEILIKIPSGDNQTVSFAAGAPAACAPLYPDTSLASFGGVYNPWFEVTFGDNGAFDVSRNIRMQGGASIDAVGSKCTSNMDTCVFKCKDSAAESCTTGYDLYNCNSANGGGGGYDPVMQGTGGGCAMGSNGEKIAVTFSN